MQTILASLLELGMSAVRYWAISHDEVLEDTKFVLMAAEGPHNLDAHLGCSIPVTECSIFEELPTEIFDRRDTPTRVHMHHREQRELANLIPKVDKDLQLTAPYTVHIPVKCHGLLHGQLSCCIQDGYADIDDAFKGGLGIIGMMLGDYQQLHAERRLAIATSEFENSEEELVRSRDNASAQVLITKLIVELLDAEHATFFDLNWYKSELTSVCNYSHETGVEDTDTGTPETFLLGEYITGKAFQEPRFRYVRNLTEVRKQRPSIVKAESFMKYMRSESPGGGSIVYGLIGRREHRGLIRVYNKRRNVNVPFSYFEIDALASACSYFSKAYDDIASYSQLDRLQRVSVSMTHNVSNIENICESVRTALTEDWIREIVVFGKLSAEANTTIYSTKLSGVDVFAQASTKYLTSCLIAQDVTWVELEDNSDGKLETELKQSGYIGMLVFPTDFANYRGGLAIPLGQRPKFVNKKPNIPKLHDSNVRAYAAIVARLIWFNRNVMASDDAQKLIGQIGHEIKSPIRKIDQVTNQLSTALEELGKQLPEYENLSYEKFVVRDDGSYGYTKKNLRKDIRDTTKQISRLVKRSKQTVDIASLTAQVSSDYIDLTFEEVDIYSLCREISQDVSAETDLWHGDRGVRCVFEFNRSFSSLPKVVCDPFIISKVIENVLRNALKYSNPPGGRKPIKIHVHANPQADILNILVGNWGMPIPEGQHEQIFQQFFRGGIVDRVHARRGMGIGLHLARLFARAHGGNVTLVDSYPDFDDPTRRNSEGWVTEFEIRISLRLNPGTKKFRLEG